MKVTGTVQLPMEPEKAYDLMQNPDLLAQAIPGCQTLEKTGEDEYKLKMKILLASLSGLFDGQVRLTEPNRPESFRMVVEGAGKIGFVKGEGVLTLVAKDGGTEVAYDGEAQIGGKIAAVGQRLIDATARLLIKKFFTKLSRAEAGEDTAGEDTADEDKPECVVATEETP